MQNSNEKEGHGQSSTARLIAQCRAINTEDPQRRQICYDPYAKYFAGSDSSSKQFLDQLERGGGLPELWVWVAARTAFFDTCVYEAVLSHGVTQIVHLGAGYDTRSNRLALSSRAKFYEVDAPQPQKDKLEIAKNIPDFNIGASVYVSCDFEKEDFLVKLEQAGFQPQQRALFIIEGVVYYLTETAVEETMKKINQQCHPQTILAFDYYSKTSVFGKAKHVRASQEALKGKLEPMIFGLNHVLPFMYDLGYRYCLHHDLDELTLATLGEHVFKRFYKFQSVCIAMKDPQGRRGFEVFSKLPRAPSAAPSKL